ncbi:MAG: DUF3703 domain-containing protein [Myxococcota bacterium]|nr:DUF3703 domain-containing protein [Myxococcota bacterium]
MSIDNAKLDAAMADYRTLCAAGDLEAALARLLDAHDVAWPSARLHVLSHLRLIRHQLLRQRSLRGVRFQLLQLCLAAPNSWTGSGPPAR